MKSKIKLALVGLLLPLLAGCISQGRDYWLDRSHDAADIFTATVGVGAGVKATVGPFHLGLIDVQDLGGVREGVNVGPGFFRSDDIDTLIFPTLIPTRIPLKRPPLFGISSAPCRTCDRVLFVNTVPLFSLPEPYGEATFHARRDPGHKGEVERSPYDNYIMMVYGDQHGLQYLTQIEAVVGLGPTLRLGLNPGELVDFVVGFFGFDLYNDDGRMPVPPPVARPAPRQPHRAPENSREGRPRRAPEERMERAPEE